MAWGPLPPSRTGCRKFDGLIRGAELLNVEMALTSFPQWVRLDASMESPHCSTHRDRRTGLAAKLGPTAGFVMTATISIIEETLTHLQGRSKLL